MARLPDRFDLQVRQARKCPDPRRQVDCLLGALAGLSEWRFLHLGTEQAPRAAEAEIEGARYLLLFSDLARLEEAVEKDSDDRPSLPVISIPTAAAMPWCLEQQAGLLVNPGGEAFLIPMDALAEFYREWSGRGGRAAAGFWIPNMTTEEEDFWREHGL